MCFHLNGKRHFEWASTKGTTEVSPEVTADLDLILSHNVASVPVTALT